MRKIAKPKAVEFAPYAIMYVGLLPDDGQVLKHLKEQMKVTKEFFLSLPEEKLSFRYEEGKWTVKEILSHIIDTERIYIYRALRTAREDKTELPGFDQNNYVANAATDKRKLKEILKEYESVRKSMLTLFNGFERKALTRTGVANGNPISVRAVAYLIAGHELHHLNIIKERYL